MNEATNSIPIIERSFGTWKISISREALSETQIAGTYDQLAQSWGRKLSCLGVRRSYVSIWLKLRAELEAISTSDGIKVLDCGIGDGAFSSTLVTTLRGDASLYGVDLSEEMLVQADRVLKKNRICASLSRADSRQLMFDDGIFDLVISAHMLEHLSNPKQAIEEMFRVLTPGGMTVFVVTRRSLIGRFIQYKWRTRVFCPNSFLETLQAIGFSATRVLRPPASFFFNASALVCVAQKASTDP